MQSGGRMRLPGGEEHHGPHKEQRVCEATPIDEDAPFTLSTIRTVLFLIHINIY